MIVFAGILFVLSFLVITGLFLVKFTEVTQRPEIRLRITGPVGHYENLWPYIQKKLLVVAKKLWHFILEAKDLKPAATKTVHTSVERMKKVFRVRIRTQDNEPLWLPEAADLTIQPGSHQNPEDLYLETIKKNPHDHQAYEALGRLYLQNKNYPDAAETYEYLIKLDPVRDIYWSNLGLAYYGLKDFMKAVTAYEKALSINNKVPTRWINLGLCFEAMEDYTKAVKVLTQALALDKLNVNYMMMLAEAYINVPNNIRAEEVLDQILSLEPTNRLAREKLMKLKI